MQPRRAIGIDLPLIAVVGALLFYLLFIPADFNFIFFQSKTSVSPPPPHTSENTAKQCPICPTCPLPKACPVSAPAPDPGENAFCLGAMSRCNNVGLSEISLCRILHDTLNSNYTGDVCSTGTSIPHIIHQSWKQAALPENFATW